MSAFVRMYKELLWIQTYEPQGLRVREEAFRIREPSVGF